MALPRGHGYRLLTDYRFVNAQVELVLWTIPDPESIVCRFDEFDDLNEAPVFCSLRLLQGY